MLTIWGIQESIIDVRKVHKAACLQCITCLAKKSRHIPILRHDVGQGIDGVRNKYGNYRAMTGSDQE